jgi:hypothetical protein
VTQEDFEFAIAKVFAFTLTPYRYLTGRNLGSQEEPGREYFGQQVVFVDTPHLLSICCNNVYFRLSRNAPVADLQGYKLNSPATLKLGKQSRFQRMLGATYSFVNVVPSLG